MPVIRHAFFRLTDDLVQLVHYWTFWREPAPRFVSRGGRFGQIRMRAAQNFLSRPHETRARRFVGSDGRQGKTDEGWGRCTEGCGV